MELKVGFEGGTAFGILIMVVNLSRCALVRLSIFFFRSVKLRTTATINRITIVTQNPISAIVIFFIVFILSKELIDRPLKRALRLGEWTIKLITPNQLHLRT